jgi:hypothetical protein|tara:strand:+ start:5239 stop:5898 length:660 start_codon:yes stop_codon:yes gene_type:complete
MNGQSGKRVSVKRVVGNVIRNLDVTDASRSLYDFVEWAFEAERKIGSYKTFVKKSVTLNIVNKQASLPFDFLKLIDIKKTGDASSSTYFSQSSASFPSDVDKQNTFYLTEDTINISTSDISSIDIAYYAIDTDDEGFPTIADNHEDAVSAYIMFKYKSRDYFNGELPRYIYMDLKQNWSQLCAQARGNDNMPSPIEMKKAAAIWNTLVPVKSLNGLLNV